MTSLWLLCGFFVTQVSSCCREAALNTKRAVWNAQPRTGLGIQHLARCYGLHSPHSDQEGNPIAYRVEAPPIEATALSIARCNRTVERATTPLDLFEWLLRSHDREKDRRRSAGQDDAGSIARASWPRLV